MHGLVRDVRVGPDPDAMEAACHHYSITWIRKRFWLAVPAIAGLLLGMLEKMELLKKKRKG